MVVAMRPLTELGGQPVAAIENVAKAQKIHKDVHRNHVNTKEYTLL
jgi:hypothetical protein